LLLTAGQLGAASFGSPGTAGSDFTKIIASTRPAAMGGAGAALGSSLSGLDLNPATLAGISGPQLEAGHISWFEDIALDRVALAWGRPQGFAFGLSYVQLGTPEITQTDLSGLETGSFKQDDRGLGLSVARPVGMADLGLTLRGLQRQLAGLSETGFEADLGLRLRLGDGWSLGLGALHLGSLSALETEADAAPSTLRAGVGWEHPLGDDVEAAISVDGVQSVDSAIQVRAGAELTLYKVLSLRAGSQYSDAFDNRQAFTAGVGLHWQGLGVDYAYAPFGALGSTQRIGISWTGNPLAKRYVPARPQWLEARRENGGAVLRWDGAGAPQWAVYLKKGADDELTRVGQVTAAESQVRLRKVANNRDIVFAVAPIDPVEGEGPRSHQMTLPGGSTAKRVDAPVPPPVKLRVIKSEGLRVQWEPGQGSPQGVLFQAYVSSRSDGGFQPLGGLDASAERRLNLGKAKRVFVRVTARSSSPGSLESDWSDAIAIEP
jgi:hypothetical protein